jgi:hypothetical protein
MPLNPRIVPSATMRNTTMLEWDFADQTRQTDFELKTSVVNAGWVFVGTDYPTTDTIRIRLRDGTIGYIGGQLTNDKEVVHMMRHYLWQRILDYDHKPGPFVVPSWVPEPLPDAVGPDTEYRPVKP